LVTEYGVLFSFEFHPDLSAIATVIAHSPIRVMRSRAVQHDFPAAFEDVDVAILEWIATESRRVPRRYPLF
jgi:hypothetical protein